MSKKPKKTYSVSYVNELKAKLAAALKETAQAKYSEALQKTFFESLENQITIQTRERELLSKKYNGLEAQKAVLYNFLDDVAQDLEGIFIRDLEDMNEVTPERRVGRIEGKIEAFLEANQPSETRFFDRAKCVHKGYGLADAAGFLVDYAPREESTKEKSWNNIKSLMSGA